MSSRVRWRRADRVIRVSVVRNRSVGRNRVAGGENLSKKTLRRRFGSAFSVSRSNVGEVIRYIQGQAEHHRVRDFKEELITFLKRHGVAYDERYIWE
jgi:hypothetical protein